MNADVDVSNFNAALARLTGGDVTVTIGFNADYAAAVHEVLTAHHEPPGQAKFLERALREGLEAGIVQRAVDAELRKAKGPADVKAAAGRGVIKAALQILAAAQSITPVDTGFLASSGTWDVEENG